MSSSGINAINSGPLIIRSYLGSSSNNTYALGDNDIPISSNRVLITSTNGLVVLSDNIYVSSITVSSINGGGGGGGGVSSITPGTNISTSGTASNPIINVHISSPLDMNGQPLIDSTGNLTLSTTTTDIYLNSGNAISMVSLGGDINITTGNNITVNGTIMTVNGNLAVLSSAITQQIVTSSITTTPVTLNSGFFGKYTFVNTNVAATIILPSPASEGSVLIFKNLMTNAFSTITISTVYSGGTISADTAASYVFTTYAGGSWVSL